MATLEVRNEGCEGFHALDGAPVVQAGPDPPDATVALQAAHPAVSGLLQEDLLQTLISQPPCHVHHRPASGVGMRPPEVAGVEYVVQNSGLLAVPTYGAL